MQEDPYYEFWRKHWIVVVYIVATIIMVASVWLWHNRLQTNPRRAFWGMVTQNLASSHVTVSSVQSSKDNSVKQTVALELGAENSAHAVVQVNQAGTKITTEVIGTPKADYTRYTSVEVPKSAPAVDTKKLAGMWARSEPRLFGQSALGLGLSLGSVPVPIANAKGKALDGLVREIQDRALYRVQFDTVKKEHKEGRLFYTYDVTAAPFVYAQIFQIVARQIGIKSLDAIDPADYRELQDIKMRLTVDVRARQLVTASYAGGYEQKYSAYGVPVRANIPEKTVTMTELQRYLQPRGDN